MGWFTRSSKVEDRALTRATIAPAMPLAWPLSDAEITPDAAMRVSDVFACVRCLADSAAMLPLVAYARTPDGGRERFNGRLADLLQRPAPGTTTASFVGTLVAHLNLFGDGFVAKYRDARGTVAQLGLLHPSTVQARIVAGEPRYTLMRSAGVSEHGVEDILHVRALSVDGITGLSPIGQARQALGLSRALSGHADAFARNAGRPGGILAIKGFHREDVDGEVDVQADLKTAFQDKFVGENSGRVMVVSGDSLEYQQLGLSLVDAQFIEQRRLSTAEIARVFRVPPWMVGAPSGDSMTYSNTESQASAFVKFSLAPWPALIEQAISADSDLSPTPVFAEFLLDGLLRADTATRALVYEKALDPDRGWMSRAEVRRLENLPAEEAPDA